jgi:hypothetical protein
MKRPVIVIVCSLLLLFALPASALGRRVKSERSDAASIAKKAQPTKSELAAAAARTWQPDEDTLSPPAQSGATAFEIPWQSVNGGGAPSSSASYRIDASVGQSTIGSATSASYEAGIGYWYGVSGGTSTCDCPYQCDYDEDAFLTALDLSALIDVLFAGRPEVQDPGCPTSRGDFNNDDFPDALDLSGLIDHLFAGSDPPCDPCNPVQSTCAP